MKSIVETTSDIMLVDPLSGALIPHDRPALIPWTSFIDTRVGLGQIKVHEADIPDSATDEEWVKFWEDSDRKLDLAIEAFVSSIKKPKNTRGKKKAH